MNPVAIAANEIIAQSWYWVTKQKFSDLLDGRGRGPRSLCFDNIEVLGGFEARKEELVRLYQEAAEKLLELGYRKVTVGCDYTRFTPPWKKASKLLRPVDYSEFGDYRDSEDKQWLLAKMSKDDIKALKAEVHIDVSKQD